MLMNLLHNALDAATPSADPWVRLTVASEGDAVVIADADGQAFAIGLAAYPATDMRRIVGMHTDEIHATLGYRTTAAAVHRNDLVLLSQLPQASQ